MYNTDDIYKYFPSPSYALPLTSQVTYKVLMDIYRANAGVNFIVHICNIVMVQVNSPAGQVLSFFNNKMVTSQLHITRNYKNHSWRGGRGNTISILFFSVSVSQCPKNMKLNTS
jgi:hypothetical protein